MIDKHIVAYLLRELPEEEAERFEEECFAEENRLAHFGAVEEELIDDYLRGELTPEQRQHFEQNYLTTEARRERVAMAAAFLRHVDTFPVESGAFVSTPPVKPSLLQRLKAFWDRQTWALRVGFAVGVMVIIAGSLWLSLPRPPAPHNFATLILSINIENTRATGEGASRVDLPPGTGALRVYLKLPEQLRQASRYRVELMNDNGDIIPQKVFGRDNESVLIEIPAAQLTRGQYALRLYAIRPDGAEQRAPGNYYFIVE